MVTLGKVGKLSHAARLWLFLIVLVFVSACKAFPERECPAFYHHDATLLLPGTVGSTYRFIDAENNVDEYKIESIDMNEPDTRIGRIRSGTSLGLRCGTTRTVRMISTDKLRGFEFAFHHTEDLRHPIENQWFKLYITLLNFSEEEDVEKQYFGFTFSSSNSYKDEFFKYYPTQVVNGKEYSDVYIKNAYGTTKVKPTPFLLNRIVLSKGHGLIQFRLVDNTEFNIVTD